VEYSGTPARTRAPDVLKALSRPTTTSPVILLAEDSEDDAYFFQRALRRTGLPHTLKRARNGKLAVEALKEAIEAPEAGVLPHIIFLDLKMPIMGGFDVLEWIRSSPASGRSSVVVLSGSDEAADRAKASELGAHSYLVKPITESQLREQLQKIFVGENSPGAPA